MAQINFTAAQPIPRLIKVPPGLHNTLGNLSRELTVKNNPEMISTVRRDGCACVLRTLPGAAPHHIHPSTKRTGLRVTCPMQRTSIVALLETQRLASNDHHRRVILDPMSPPGSRDGALAIPPNP